ncbi:Methyltransferase domain-containing protein [Desulfonatronum thiosulfatophilum]|uniref:Methyltransferase domain-containing protein n=1 Tax=Desulfonatronum thiosulfatophilum TaxID=617002 RepID=A0A1G6E8M1_9BACT|nr:class I SAM-dependent methyltransferase [Desulfonatronum thiosulfatophilum]SDB53712.1 Methyltransferase domain-containing protein [Desulfonatronum thiosulfatophilum]
MGFDFGPYQFVMEPDEKIHWNMDFPHIQILYGLAMMPGLLNVVEIGSFRGASTAAFIQSQKDGAGFHLHVVEIKPRWQLIAILNEMPKTRWSLYTEPIQHLDLPTPDLILIDGDHGAPALIDALAALCLGSGIIVMHDSQTHVTITNKNHWGAHQAAKLLKMHKDREWWEDCRQRPGMLTERGLFVSWPKSMPGVRECLERKKPVDVQLLS